MADKITQISDNNDHTKDADDTNINSLVAGEESQTNYDEENGNPIILEETPQGGQLIKANLADEMKSAYLDYAMSVIVARALPDVRDGLKPVQRRIIYAMQDQGNTSSAKFTKSAAIIGEVMKKYHPHGDTSVYDAMVRMAQDFSLRYMLVHGQGNFGSIDGDPPAAHRYTEAKLHKIAEELYRDIDKQTVDFELNDLQVMEPKYLPSLLPNLLLNGASGIAVGMATNIPPHNLNEVVDGILLMIEDAETIGSEPTDKDVQTYFAFPDEKQGEFSVKVAKSNFSSQSTTEDLVKVIKGPDFPTGGTIYDQTEIIKMYATGKGKIVTRAKMNIEEPKGGRMQIVATEIPYQVNKATLIAKIADLVKEKKIEGISDLRDESNKEGLRIVIELKKDALPQKVQNRLYKYSQLQTSFAANIVALLDGEPKLLTLKTILEEFIKHRQQVTIRRVLFMLKRTKAREHILQGLKKALDNIDEIINLIRSSPDADKAKEGLVKKFDLTPIQAQAILDMQLRRLAALERQKIEEELQQVEKAIEDFENILSSPKRVISIVKEELEEIKEKYGDERRTKVVKGRIGEINEEDLVAEEKCVVTISKSGYIKRMKPDAYRKQGRGGTGVSGASLKEDDVIEKIRICSTHDTALFFTSSGKAYKMRVWDIPESSRQAKGTALVNFLNIRQDEKVQAFLALTTNEIETGSGFLFFVTRKGTVKKTSLSDFENIRTNGIVAIKLSEEDELITVRHTSGNDDIIIITANGQSIRFHEETVRTMGRSAGGVTGIRLSKKADNVVGASLIFAKADAKINNVVTITEKGYGKKTSIDEYKSQNRGGSGIKTYNVTDRTGKVVVGRVLEESKNTDVLIASEEGKIIRLAENEITKLGRSTQGVRLIKLGSGDTVTGAAFIEPDAEEELDQE